MNKLPCEECTKTNNHCCKADIPLEIPIALSIINKAKEFGFNNIFFVEHPKFPQRVVLIKKEWTKRGSVDIQNENCVFFKDGKCGIYEYRPDICRWYGTQQMRCRWEASNIKPEQIAKATIDDIHYYDELAIKKSLINKEV